MSVLDIGTLGGRIELDSRLEQTLDQAEEHVKHFGEHFLGEFDKLTLGVGALSAAVVGFGATIVALGVSGSRIVDVENGFNRLAGSAENAEEVLKAMREGVKGTVNDLELMTNANKLMGAGVSANAANFGTLTAAANVLSREGYGPLETIMSTLNRAEQTGMLRRLAYIGVTGNMKVAEEEYAHTLGSSFAALSQTQKVEAERYALMQALNKVVAEGGIQTLSFAQMVNQTSVAMANWVEKLEATIAKSPELAQAFLAIRDALIKAFGGDSDKMLITIVGWVTSFAETVTKYGPGIVETFGRIIHTIEAIFSTVKEAWDSVPEWMRDIAKDALVAGAAAYVAEKGFDALSGSLAKLGGEGGGKPGEGLLSYGANIAQITSQLPGAGAKFEAFNKQVYGSSPVEQARKAADALKAMGGAAEGSGAAALSGGAKFVAAATEMAKTAGYVYIAEKSVEIGAAVWGYVKTGMEQNSLAAAELATHQIAMKTATELSTHAAGEQPQVFTDTASAVKFLNTHIKDQASGIVYLRDEYLKLHPVIKQVTDATEAGAEAQATAEENVKEAKKGVTEAEAAVKNYADAQKIAAVADGSTAVAHAKLHDALLVLMGTTKEAVANNLLLANSHLTAAQKAEVHATALTALSTKIATAANKVDVTSDAIEKMTGAERVNADVAKLTIPLLDQKIAKHTALTEVERGYLALHATIAVNEMNYQVDMLKTIGLTIEQVEALKVLGYSEKQIADQQQVDVAVLKKATDGWVAHRQAVLDDANAQLKYTTTDLQQTIKGIQDKYDASIRGHLGQTAADVEFLADAKKRRDDDVAAQLIDLSVLSKTSIASLQDTANKQKATYDFMAANVLKYNATARLAQKETTDEAAAAAKGIDVATFKTSEEGLTNLANTAKQKYADMAASGLSFNSVVQIAAKETLAIQIAALEGLTAAQYKQSREGLQLVADAAQAALDKMRASHYTFSQDVLQQQKNTVQAANDAARGLGDTTKEMFDKMKANMESTRAAGEPLSNLFIIWLTGTATNAEKASLGFDHMGHAIAKTGDAAAEAKKQVDALIAANRALGGSNDITSKNFAEMIAGTVTGNNASGITTLGSGFVGRASELAKKGYSFAEIIKILTGSPGATLEAPLGPKIPGFIGGGRTNEQYVMVGEGGSEIVKLPIGSTVYPHGMNPPGFVPGFAGGGIVGSLGSTLFSRSKAALDHYNLTFTDDGTARNASYAEAILHAGDNAYGPTDPSAYDFYGALLDESRANANSNNTPTSSGISGFLGRPTAGAAGGGAAAIAQPQAQSGGGAGGRIVLNIAAGAIVHNFPIIKDPAAMAQLADITGQAVLKKLTDGGWRPTPGVIR
jgi:hypothetical protein